ncbi:MAG: PorT family protein [Cytophagaceae bacterium]|jgi:hypothetical protein|nr:PorT family protein [Cytophagaceae bacterium]
MRTIFIILIAFLWFAVAGAQKKSARSIEISAVLGYNIGATAPIPLPAEVREIKEYNPKFNPEAGLDFFYKLNSKWGAGSTLSVDWKGMRVKDRVKYMYTSISAGDASDDKMTGYFVGTNMTNVDMTYLTISLYGTYQLSERIPLNFGIYVAKVLATKFNGSVSDGYIRIETPVGTKQDINEEEAFDFSNSVRDYDFGLTVGGKYKLTERFGIYAQLDWGLLSFFYADRNPMQFTMHNVYGTIGLKYRLTK